MPEFGNFKGICETAPLPLCRLVEGNYASGPTCYSRSIDAPTFVLFQPAALVMLVISLIMTVFMVVHIRTKYTAIGRKEISVFFYIFILENLVEFVVLSGLVPTRSVIYPYLVSTQLALISASVFCLLVNGFVGFQFVEDGSKFSIWMVRLSSLAVGGLSFCISIGTFSSILLSSKQPVVLWVWLYVIHGAALVVYAVMQIFLIIKTLDDLWPIGNIVFGLGFFFLGQAILIFLSLQICKRTSHYVDGLFFTTLCTLLAIMMVYKYWDSLTKDDLEFVVSGERNQWEVKELLDEDFNNDDGPLEKGSEPYLYRNSILR